MKAIVVAGVTSGVGKTTVSTGLMGVLSRRLKVQPFKTGPDYIDPGYHTWMTGEASRNLDTWLLSHKAVIELFNRAMIGKDVAVIEGVMGLYDGRSSTSDDASTAELAKLLGVPVLLVVDGRKAARSLAAVVKGYRDFDPSLRVGGVVLNGMGSDSHFRICREAIEHYTGIKVFGYLPRRENLVLPERHLGLIPAIEGPAGEEFRRALISQCEANLDIPGILELAESAVVPEAAPELFPEERRRSIVKIAVARDKAFSFYYQDSLDLLEAWGAELAPFSPLHDEGLPESVSGIYIGGGFPEMFAEELARNAALKQSLREAVGAGVPTYAECGGLMYLGTRIRDLEGKDHAMAGVLPLASRIDERKLNLGYRTVEALADGPLMRKGETVRGHEFHWSGLDGDVDVASAYRVAEKGCAQEGFQTANVLASYVHLHMGSRPSMAPRFVEVCREFKRNRASPHS